MTCIRRRSMRLSAAASRSAVSSRSTSRGTLSFTAGFPEILPVTTADRQCGSSQQAATFAAQGVMAGFYDIVIAAGVESMSRSPMFSATGDKDAYGRPRCWALSRGPDHSGVSAEIIASRWKLDRQDLDEFVARSHRLAAEATAAGQFTGEILPVPVATADGSAGELRRRDDPRRDHCWGAGKPSPCLHARPGRRTVSVDQVVDQDGQFRRC